MGNADDDPLSCSVSFYRILPTPLDSPPIGRPKTSPCPFLLPFAPAGFVIAKRVVAKVLPAGPIAQVTACVLTQSERLNRKAEDVVRVLSLLIAMTLSACFAEDVPPAEPQPTAPQGPGPTTASSATATDERLVVYDRSVTAGNPLKGFLTSYQWSVPDDRLPHGLEFLYLPISAVLEGPQTYAFESGFEPHLEESKARGNHLVIRFYLDYPGSDPGLPQWLLSQINCTEYTDYGGGCSPDYNDPLLQSTVLEFIAALGARYDGDNRVGFIQIGLLGFWGEWHTYPQSELFASNTFQQQVIAAFDQAFDQTHVMLRYPVHDSPDRAIGYHDDSFAYATLGEIDWFFYPKLLAAQADERWQHVPIGGEVYPDLQASLFSSDYVVDTYSQDFAQCAEQTHISWMINNAAFVTDNGYQGSQLEGAQAASLAMGYEFSVPRFALTASGLKGGTIDIELSVEISNTGVAPFYYPLALQLSDAVDEPRILASNLQTLQPGETRTLGVSLEGVAPELLSRTYSLSLSSSILFGDQVIQFADASADKGALDLTPNFGCDVEGTRLKVGERLDDCFCDVDGQLVGGSGGACE